jgi:UDP-N-acetylmuramoyl-tripeptide--D-alanyl-D-alanine ligase
VITNIYPVHLEFFSSLEDIARAKKELLDGMDPGGLAVINRDDALVREIASDFPGKTVSFSLEGDADYIATCVRSMGLGGMAFTLLGKDRECAFHLPLPGKHNVANALAALAAASEFGASWEEMKTVLAGMTPMEGRGRFITSERGFHILDDTYNSNPAALSKAADMLSGMACDGKKVLAAGDMLELGREGPALHRRAGEAIAALGLDILVGVGELAAGICDGALAGGMPQAHVFKAATSKDAVPLLRNILDRGDIVLIKGSRAVGMDVIIRALAGKACLQSS